MARVTKDVADRREDILEAVLELISENGIRSVRGADIAKRVGVSVGLVFYHFESLPALIAAAVKHAAARDVEARNAVLARGGDAAVRLRAVLREYGPTGSAFGWRLWVESWTASLRDVTLRNVVAELDSGWQHAIAGVIADGVEEGLFVCADPVAAARRITAMLDGLAVQHVVFDGSVSIDQIDDWMGLIVVRELGVAQ